MSFYEQIRDGTAQPLIRQFGKPATIIRATSSAPTSAWSPASSAEPRSTLPVRILDEKSAVSERLREAIQTSDKAGLISTEGVTTRLQLQDNITIDGKTYRFVMLEPLEPGETIVLYEFVARA